MSYLSRLTAALLLLALSAPVLAAAPGGQPVKTWTADNGNGTYTNPIFYDEFSDPDLIRVDDWFYLTGTTMHTMPGLPVLRSRDLVNWEFLSYAMERLDYGPEYRLEQGKSMYGRGIWAPSLRYHRGTFYIFSNVNGRKTQIFTASDPRGPWRHREMQRSLHDLSVLFEDDGKAYAVWGHQEMRMAQLTDDLSDIVPATEKVLFTKNDGMGEGAHLYKIDGKYYIISANYAGGFRMPAARADRLFGPYEVNRAISKDEAFGMAMGHSLADKNAPTSIRPPNPAAPPPPLHQGGIVRTPAGEWWGFSMMDANAVGRLLSLSPVTWHEGWPYFGLPGNLTRTPRTWVKPKTAAPQPVQTPFARSADFSAAVLQPIWQWNHAPVAGKWSLAERPGYLRLRALPATSFWDARNSLTQRAIGPRSTPTVAIDVAALAPGDVAGLALLNFPYAALGIERGAGGLAIALYDQARDATVRVPVAANRLWLRAECDFLSEQAVFSYSTDGKAFQAIGAPFTMVFQLKTFQGVRYALFNYNRDGADGGYADFDSVEIHQPYPRGLMRPIPYGERIALATAAGGPGLHAAGNRLAVAEPSAFLVHDMGQGRVALQAGAGYLTIAADRGASLQAGAPGLAQSFQWMETPTGELALMSLASNRFLRLPAADGRIAADSPGPQPGGGDGARLLWKRVDGVAVSDIGQ